jgi:hypothetical protein
MLAVLGGLWRERRKQKWRNFRLAFGENRAENLDLRQSEVLLFILLATIHT